MRSKGSRFTLGVWGLRVCSLDGVKPFATVRNRSREACMAVPMVISAKGSVLVVSDVASPRFAWQAWHFVIPTCFRTRRRSFCVASARLLRRFQKMRSSFRGRRSTLATSIVISCGRQAHSSVGARVSVCPWIGGVPGCPCARMPRQGFSASRAENN